MSHDLLMFFRWWFGMMIIGAVAWPLARRFFKSYPDRGYILSKILGLVLAGFINWLLCSLHIVPFSPGSVILAIGLVAAASWSLKPDSIREWMQFLKTNQKLVLLVEGAFFVAFLAFTLIRMGNPDIAQTEKMPDFAFLSGIVTSDSFPPRDPWFAGGTINYFYYGHYLVGLMTQLTMVPVEYGYNLGVALVFALTLLGAAGVSYGLTRRIGYGLTGGMFVAVIGNLDCAVQLMAALSEIASGQKKFFPFSWFNWWMSSRVIVREGIDITINEFPFWSYILGDLHAHMNVVPISLLVLAVILELFRSSGDGLESLGRGSDKWFRAAVAAIALGAIPCANTWDMPTYFALTAAAIMLGRQFNRQVNTGKATHVGKRMTGSEADGATAKQATAPAGAAADAEPLASIEPPTDSISMIQVVLSPLIELRCFLSKTWQCQRGMFLSWLAVILVVAAALLLYSPFHLTFKPAGTKGLHWLNAEQRTLVGDFLTIYGFFFYILIPFVVALVYPRFQRLNERLKPLVGITVGLLFFVFLIGFQRFMVTCCLLTLGLILAIPLKRSDPEIREKFFALALFVMVLLILLGCEFLYIKDAYGKSLERQNTVFKFYYQAWIFCGIASAYAMYWIRERADRVIANAWEPGFRILFLAVLLFPVVGSTVKTGGFRGFTDPSQVSRATLDGMFYMTWQHKGDYEVIHWLRKNATPEQRVLEAAGPAFSHYGRISAGTGMATIMGWANHENIWREGDWKVVGARGNEVKTVYTSTDANAIRKVLDTYAIDFVYYGKLEREQYPGSSPDRFSFMEKVVEIRDSDQKMSYLFRYGSQSVD